MSKINCWEFMKCGREPRGSRVSDRGVCPAATETRSDGIHGGTNGGRTCWVIAGTFCGGEVQTTFVMKYQSCSMCPFYSFVMKEEGERYLGSARLRSMVVEM